MRKHLQTSNGAKGRNCCQNLETHIITRVAATSGGMQPLLRMSSLRKPPRRPSRVFREYIWLSFFQADSRAPLPAPLVVGWDHVIISSWRAMNGHEVSDFHHSTEWRFKMLHTLPPPVEGPDTSQMAVLCQPGPLQWGCSEKSPELPFEEHRA